MLPAKGRRNRNKNLTAWAATRVDALPEISSAPPTLETTP
jgi:hypothetical protein